MQKYLACFLKEQNAVKSNFFPEYCLKKLQRTIYYGNRNMVPSTTELDHIKVKSEMKVTVSCMVREYPKLFPLQNTVSEFHGKLNQKLNEKRSFSFNFWLSFPYQKRNPFSPFFLNFPDVS